MSIGIGGGYNAGRINPYVNPATKKNAPAEVETQTPQGGKSRRAEFVKSSDSGIRLAEKLQQGQERRETIYDQPSIKASKAISTYSAYANLERRAEVQSLIGVDIYA